MLPPRKVRRPAALRIAAVIAAVVDLPLLPVTPMIRAGQFSMNNSISVQSRAPERRATCSHGLLGPHGRIDHDQVGVAKILFPVAAEMDGGDRHVGQQRQRVGQGGFVGQIGHGDDGPLPGEPACGGRPAAEMAQPMIVARRPR